MLLRLRLPWLVAGLLAGVALTYFISRFEVTLAHDVRLAFFIPLIVYISDAVGTQTETIYVRHLAKKVTNFSVYLFKEIGLGLILGVLFGAVVGLLAAAWLGSTEVALTVGLAMAVSIASAPPVALVTANILYREHTDPAVGGGPFATIIQDFISILIYFAIASAIILT